MTTSRLWLLQPRPSSPAAFRRRRSMRPHPRLGPQAGKTPPSAGPELSCWREAFQEGRLRFDTARSLAAGYSFVGAHAGAGVLPVLTGNRGQPVTTRILRLRSSRPFRVESDRIA